ncbi:MAG: CBS domain-containing protein [Candidatus Aenigmatarchaeota archaeon]|nr:MAG: CBS domain-containing protein [Candidatus Aenigmarchaeota archaeon]
MLVKDVMKREVIAINPDISIREASKVMSKHNIGSLLVLDDEKLVGILTERDVLNLVARGENLDEVKVKDVMSRDVITIESDKKIEDAVDLMLKHKIKKLPVMESGKIVGIITTSDIIVAEPKLIEAIASLISLRIPGYRGG